MKKVLGKTIFVILIFVGIISVRFNLIEKKVNKDNLILDYYLANNENKIFDVNGDGFPIPMYNYAEPFDFDLGKIANESNIIDRILPYYPLGIGINERESELTFTYDKKTKKIGLPYEVKNELTFRSVEIMAYTDENVILSCLDIIFIDNKENGIYITERFLDACGINNPKNLEIKASVLIPITAKTENRERIYIDEKNTKHTYEYVSYEIDRYEEVEYTFPISGIIEKENLGFETFDEATLLIPHSLSEEIYNVVNNKTSVILEENEFLWKPSTYIVTLTKKVGSDELAHDLSNYINNFILEGMRYQEDVRTHIYSEGVEMHVNN